MDSFIVLLLFGVILSSFNVVLALSVGSCGNNIKVLKPDATGTCNARKLYQGSCLTKCPVGYYAKSGKCLSCHTPCSSCNENRCLSCEGSYYLSESGLCVKTCTGKTLMKNSSSPRVRLEGNSSLEGVVEVYHNGSWGTVCANGWGGKEAMVLCKELKLGNVIEAKIVGKHRFDRTDGYKNMKIWLNKISCKGTENSILDCDNQGWDNNQCSHLEDVGVRCSGPDKTNTCESSCGDGYFSSNNRCLECPIECKTCTAIDKCLSCHEMRFLEDDSCVKKCKVGSFGSSETGKCQRCPEQCTTCEEKGNYPVCTSCTPSKDNITTNFLNGDQCQNTCPNAAFSKYLRLSGNFSGTPYEGLLEVRYEGKWHTVCADGFYLSTARVFCRELGYGQPIHYGGGKNGRGTGKIIAQNVRCSGNEQSFTECQQSDWFSFDCSHIEDVGLKCQPPPDGYVVQDKCIAKCPIGTFKNKKNVCELCNFKCLTCSENPENCLSCRKPYFHNGTACARSCPVGTYPNATLRHCLSCDKQCLTCSERPDGCLSCRSPLLLNDTHCGRTCPAMTYRKEYSCVTDCGLRHYPEKDVCHACSLNCLFCTSRAVCKACENGFVLTKQGKCERSCPANQYWTSLDPKSVGINLSLRLSSVKGSRFKGRLEVKYQGVWGSICDDGWSDKNAAVACRQLLLGPPVQNLYLNSASFEELNISRIWLDDVHCEGTEGSLEDCKHRDWGRMNCVHSEDVHIECSIPGISSCKSKCPSAHYNNGTVCKPCSVNCLNCSGASNNCSSCTHGYNLNDSTCVGECPPGLYTKDGICQPCHTSCWTCEGPGKKQCTSCQRPKTFSNKQCLTKCPSGEYKQGINPYIELWRKVGPYEGVVMVSVKGRKGLICHRYLRIEDGHVVCKHLQMGKALKVYQSSMYFEYSVPILIRNPLCVGNESSIFNCRQRSRYTYCSRRNIFSVRCSGPDTSNHCVKDCAIKKNYYIAGENVCSICSTNCLRCEKNATHCTACPKGLLLTWENKCEKYCREGTFFDKTKMKCEKCDGSCVACYKNKRVCTLCPRREYLSDKGCLENCTNMGSERRGSAELRLFRAYAGHRIPSRGIVQMFSNGHWLPLCAVNWSIQTAAIVCHQLGYGDPVDIFSMTNYMLGLAIANTVLSDCTGKQGKLSLARKDGSAEDVCVVKIGPCPNTRMAGIQCNRSTPKKECVTSCGPGFFLTQDKTKCLPCSNNCTTCNVTANTCTTCDAKSALHGTRCLDTCPDGYFIHLGKMVCERCSDECLTCLDGWRNNACSSCRRPYYLRNTSCVETCYPDHNLEDLMNADKSPDNIRLVNGSNDQEGYVQVKKNDEWGVICYANQFISNLVCQQLGFQSSKSVQYIIFDDFADIPKWSVSCQNYEKSLADCSLRTSWYCMRKPFIVCNNRPLNTRVCRKENEVPCSRGVCFDSTSCVPGNGKIIPKEHSYCRYCPPDFHSDGVTCQSISRSKLLVRATYKEVKLLVRRRYYFPCFGRSGRRIIRPHRNSWSKDGKQLELESGRFILGPVNYHDTGIYKCVLQNSLGSVTITFNVTIRGVPLITRADNAEVIRGQSAMLNCEVFANPPATITWRMGNITFNENSTRHNRSMLNENGSLWIHQTISKDAGIYECSASNRFGTTRQFVTLHIVEEISFRRKAGSKTVAKGEKATFKCSPLHVTDNTSIKWRRKGTTLTSGEKYELGDDSLTIKNVESKDCGEYYCVVRNEQSIITSIGTLAIKNESPCIHTPPENLKVEVGMYAKFYCGANGDPEPTILWQNKKQPDANVFEIKEVNPSHVGVYICTARSKDKESHAYAFLTVADQYPCPYIFEKPNDTGAKFGETATFHCDGVAVSLLTITWHKGNSIISQSKKYSLENGNKKLVINDVSEDDIGVYKCVVTGVHGRTMATAALTSVHAGAAKGSGSSSPSTAGIVIGVLICILVILIILYFVHRYRRHGATPVDVIKDVKRKTLSRFQSPTRHTVLKYDTSEYNDYNEDDAYDTSDTNPFVRDQ